MAVSTFKMTANDTLTPLGRTLKQKNTSGVLTAVNLTGLTVKFKMVNDAGTTNIAETATGVTVITAASGTVQFDFSTVQVALAGTYGGWFVVYSGAESTTFPVGRCLQILIVEDE